MEFFFPDSQDQVNPFFDFQSEEFPKHRVRQRDDHYAHEALRAAPYDGILVSKAIVDGSTRGAGRYSMAQSQRLYRLGVSKFFRVDKASAPLLTMGDCGAFTYAEEAEPLYTVSEVVDFYEALGFDRGVSLDHIVFGFLGTEKVEAGAQPDADWIRRRELTIELAAEFIADVHRRGGPFEPVGAAHGWDCASYQKSVEELQNLGFTRISLGGMVPLRTNEVRAVIAAVSDVRKPETQLHLLGVTRIDHVHEFLAAGVTSFDSTTPLRQAFKDERDNYYAPGGERFSAIRVPQVDANPSMKRRIAAGQIDQRAAVACEQDCLAKLRAFDSGQATVTECVEALRTYEEIWDGKKDRSDRYRRTLEAAPWKSCRCGICDDVSVEVVLFRGSERNKRRGFHNLSAFRADLDRLIDEGNTSFSPTSDGLTP